MLIKYIYKFIAVPAAIMLVCSSCSGVSSSVVDSNQHENKSDTDNSSSIVDHKGVLTDYENLIAQLVIHGSMCPVGDGDSVYQVSSSVRYCDPAAGDMFITYCSSAGCSHSDSTCSAYIGNASMFISYKGMWYYVVSEGDNNKLICHDPKTNKRNVIYKTDNISDEEHVTVDTVNSFMISHDRIYLVMNHTDQNFKTGEAENYITFFEIDLKTTETREILSHCSDNSYMQYLGGNGESHVVVSGKSNISLSGELIIDEDLRVYDTSFSSYESICTTADGYLTVSDMFGIIYENKLVYGKNDEIHLYDLSTKEDSIVKKANGRIIRCRIDGDLIHYIVDEGDKYTLYVLQYSSGMESAIETIGENEGITARVEFATENGYICSLFSNGTLRNVWMSQEAYDRGKFESYVMPE